jgi:hypothetical protein
MDAGIDRFIELALAFSITFFAAGQWITSCQNNKSTTSQTGQLITAAKINACAAQKIADASERNAAAAESFSESASHINEGVGNAVGKLQLQVDQVRRSADVAKTASETAKEALHVSGRAYVTTEEPRIDSQSKDIVVGIVNSGHIPSGKMTDIVHQATYSIAQVGDQIDWNSPTDKSWQHNDWQSIQPGNHNSMLVPLPSFDESMYNSGHQLVVVAGTLTYNDGFSDTPQRVWKFCLRSIHHLVTNKTYLIGCDPEDVIPRLEKVDGYPQNEHSP